MIIKDPDLKKINLPPEKPDISEEEESLQRVFRKMEILPLPESMLINTLQLRMHGQELVITPKGFPSSEFIIIRYSPSGPVLIRFSQDDSEVSEPIPKDDDFLSLCDGEADGPAISFCAWGDFVMVGTEAGAYNYKIINGNYEDDFQRPSPKISAARDEVRQMLATAGPTPTMLEFYGMEPHHEKDDFTPTLRRAPAYQVLAKAWNVHMMRMETTHGGNLPELDAS